jgi:hypothetical protein
MPVAEVELPTEVHDLLHELRTVAEALDDVGHLVTIGPSRKIHLIASCDFAFSVVFVDPIDERHLELP